MNNRKLAYSILITCTYLILCRVTYAQHADPYRILPEKREAWIRSAILKLQSLPSDTTIINIELQEVSFEDYFRLKVRLKGKGMLHLSGKEFVCFLTSSAHDQPEVGDISLAVDRRGRIFQNNGHVCGGIIHFETGKIRKLKNSRQFFRYFVSDTDGEGWQRVKGEN